MKRDRVAIIGRGIAVVDQVNDTHVLVLLWNRTALRIGRKDILRDELNMRWEASADRNSSVPAFAGSMTEHAIAAGAQ